jgi:hypothetical protein
MAKPKVARANQGPRSSTANRLPASKHLAARTLDISKAVEGAIKPAGTARERTSLLVRAANRPGCEALLALVRLLARQAATAVARSGSPEASVIGSPQPP